MEDAQLILMRFFSLNSANVMALITIHIRLFFFFGYCCNFRFRKCNDMLEHVSKRFCFVPARENVDLNRVPQVIYEAVCLTSHSCRGVDGASRVESVPLAIRMPVLRVNPACQLRAIEFESINIACICATARQN
uniref:Uncharacterized protein n=1 Tax=Electrophorus electricus TaxID=8005 RepID=A0A4W4F2N9_ELEEL